MEFYLRKEKLVVKNPTKDFGNYFIYMRPTEMQNEYGGKYIDWIPSLPFFKGTEEPDTIEFPTHAWIYPIFEYLATHDKSNLDSIIPLLTDFFREVPTDQNYYHAREEQIEVLKKLLKFNRGILNVRTGWGKTTVINILTKLFLDQGLTVMVLAPKSAVLNEIRSRYEDTFNESCKYYYDETKKLNFVNPKGLFRTKNFNKESEYLRKIDVLLFDEVEDCMNQKMLDVFYGSMNPKYVYGFSGSSNKYSVEPIKFTSKGKLHPNQLNLLHVFGHTVHFELPTDRDFTIRQIKPDLKLTMQDYLMDCASRGSNETDSFNQVPIYVAGSTEFSKMVRSLFHSKQVKNLVIPMVSRVAMKEFCEANPDLRLGLIHGSGTGCEIRYSPDEDFQYISMKELKRAMKDEEIDIVVTSAAGFAGVDYPPNWDSCLAFPIGTLLNRTVQAPGRVSRAYSFNLYYCMIQEALPVYNKHVITMVNAMEKTYQNGKYRREVLNLNR